MYQSSVKWLFQLAPIIPALICLQDISTIQTGFHLNGPVRITICYFFCMCYPLRHLSNISKHFNVVIQEALIGVLVLLRSPRDLDPSQCTPLLEYFYYGVIPYLPLDKMATDLADDSFKRIFFNEKFCISIRISLKFVPRGPIDNRPELVQVMAPNKQQAIS